MKRQKRRHRTAFLALADRCLRARMRNVDAAEQKITERQNAVDALARRAQAEVDRAERILVECRKLAGIEIKPWSVGARHGTVRDSTLCNVRLSFDAKAFAGLSVDDAIELFWSGVVTEVAELMQSFKESQE